MICSLYVTSNPPGVEIIGSDQKGNTAFEGSTPNLFTELLTGTYDISLPKEYYEGDKWMLRVDLSSAKIDTIDIQLTGNSKPFYKKWWTWAAGGGLVTAAIVAIISTKESTKSQSAPPDLPLPPDRP